MRTSALRLAGLAQQNVDEFVLSFDQLLQRARQVSRAFFDRTRRPLGLSFSGRFQCQSDVVGILDFDFSDGLPCRWAGEAQAPSSSRGRFDRRDDGHQSFSDENWERFGEAWLIRPVDSTRALLRSRGRCSSALERRETAGSPVLARRRQRPRPSGFRCEAERWFPGDSRDRRYRHP